MCHISGTCVRCCARDCSSSRTSPTHVKTFLLAVSSDELDYLANSWSFCLVSFVYTYCSTICSLCVPLVRFLRVLIACNKLFFLLSLPTLLYSKKRSRWCGMGEKSIYYSHWTCYKYTTRLSMHQSFTIHPSIMAWGRVMSWEWYSITAADILMAKGGEVVWEVRETALWEQERSGHW